MKKIILSIALCVISMSLFAQDFVDNALLFGRPGINGSARIQALGGTQISLGGDYSSGFSNPAGLGMYNRSEFTFSPAITNIKNTSNYLGSETSDSKTVFNIPGLSLVYHHETGKEKGFLSGSFGVSMTRSNNLNQAFRYKGTNNQHSIIDYFIADSYGINPESYLIDNNGNYGENFHSLSGLAYNNFLTEDYIDDTGNYAYRSVLNPLPAEGDLPAEIRTVDQEEISEIRGAQYQWSFSYGANIDDKLFLGAGVGITSIRFKARQMFKESNYRFDLSPDYNPLDNFQTDETYDIRGSGANLTLGAIFRPVDFLQFGASYVTPTYYAITDNYSATIASRWNRYNTVNENDPAYNPSFPDQPNVSEQFDQPLVSEYDLRTPKRISAGATFISKLGFVSADVEFVNYSKAKYSSSIDEADYSFENVTIKSDYQDVINYRIGAEYRHDKYRVRGGYNFMADPYRQDDGIDQSIQSFSGGLGYRSNDFFIDLAAVFSNTNRSRSPYAVNGPDPVAYQKIRSANYMVTFGFIF